MKTATKPKSAKAGKSSKSRPVAAKKSKPSSPKKVSAPPPGLEFREFEALRRQLDLSLAELSARLGLSRPTIVQRKATGRLTPDESGKAGCFARLPGHAVHLFGRWAEARQRPTSPPHRVRGAVRPDSPSP